jgi:hypothetical protein
MSEDMKDAEHGEWIARLGGDAAKSILLELCADEQLREEVTSMVKARLSQVDATAVSDGVYRALNALDVHDLWESSGETYYGYEDPTDVAHEMVVAAITPFVEEMKKRHDGGLVDVERAYCLGIVRGLLRYADEGVNEFKDWAPDDPFEAASEVFAEWSERNPDGDAEALKVEAGL